MGREPGMTPSFVEALGDGGESDAQSVGDDDEPGEAGVSADSAVELFCLQAVRANAVMTGAAAMCTWAGHDPLRRRRMAKRLPRFGASSFACDQEVRVSHAIGRSKDIPGRDARRGISPKAGWPRTPGARFHPGLMPHGA
jgi:hypothetical protein